MSKSDRSGFFAIKRDFFQFKHSLLLRLFANPQSGKALGNYFLDLAYFNVTEEI